MAFFAKFLTLALIAVCYAAPVYAADADHIAVIDIEALVTESEAGKSMQTQLSQKRDEFQKEFSRRESELSEKEKKLVAQKGDMTAEQLGKERRAFEADLLETRKLFQKRRTALDKGLSDAMKELRRQIAEATAEVAEQKGYQVVLLRDSVVIMEKDLDITKDVLAKLNAKIKTIPVTVN